MIFNEIQILITMV